MKNSLVKKKKKKVKHLRINEVFFCVLYPTRSIKTEEFKFWIFFVEFKFCEFKFWVFFVELF